MYIWQEKTWLNCNNSIFSSLTLHYGQGLFETIYVQNRNPHNLEAHLHRLQSSIACLFPLESSNINYKSLKNDIKTALSKLTNKPYVLKILMIYSVATFTPLLFLRDYPYQPKQLQAGFSLIKASSTKYSKNILLKHKTTNYFENILEKNRAKQLCFDDAYFINELGNITETTVANIYFINDNKIYTPMVSDGLLPGTIRSQLLKSKFPILEITCPEETFLNSESIFITNSLIGLIPIKKINQIPLKTSSELINELTNFIGQIFVKEHNS